MSGFAAIQDMSSSSSIFHTLREVGQYFHHHTASLCQTGYESEALDSSLTSLPDEACKNAATALHPLAYHLQNRAQEEQKEELGEMLAADSNVVEHLCKGILYPFINGNQVLLLARLHVKIWGRGGKATPTTPKFSDNLLVRALIALIS